jgi:UDP-2,3-diacylglucosamine hydrolase
MVWRLGEGEKMRIFFISDIHLAENSPGITHLFLHFLENIAPNADRLYILGDLFELWVGDDNITPFHQQIIAALAKLSKKIPIYFIHGNRDFLIGKNFAKTSGMTLLSEKTLIQLDNYQILLMHGDTLCTDDVAYQKARRRTRRWWVKKAFLFLPLIVRQALARHLRRKSEKHTKMAAVEILDVNQPAVQQCLADTNAHYLIHGHTHRPAIHQVNMPNASICQRIVLADWKENKGNYLAYDTQTGFELVYF